MKEFTAVKAWAERHPLIPVHVDCAITVMLKILDGKCKMKTEEKEVMSHLYRAVKRRPSRLLGKEAHQLIQRAEQYRTPEMIEEIYEMRVLAETMISRPIMKTFKAVIREQGLFEVSQAERYVPGEARGFDLVAEFV